MNRPSLFAAGRSRGASPSPFALPELFAPSVVRIRFAVPRATTLTVHVVDTGGSVVRTVYQGQVPAGEHSCCWDGRDAHGLPAGRGLYTLRLLAAGALLTSRVVAVP